MSKDPAVLFYIDNWLTSTAEMDSDCRGWYLNLILHQYDKETLPNDIEKLAVLAGVKFSEFERFQQVFQQVLKQKFILLDSNRLANPNASEVLIKREMFKSKRARSGKVGSIIKVAMGISGYKDYIYLLKKDLEKKTIEELNDMGKTKQVLQQVLKQMLTLYINGDININKDKEIKDSFELFWNQFHSITGKSKSDKEPAFRHWKKLTLEEQRLAYKNIDLYFNSLSESKYCKKARTYLGDKSFNDEFVPGNQESGFKSVDWYKDEIRKDEKYLGGVNVKKLKEQCFADTGVRI